MIEKIIEKLNLLKNNNQKGYRCFQEKNHYYGLDKEGNIVFLIQSNNLKPVIMQETKHLMLIKNLKCLLSIDGKENKGYFDIIICMSKDCGHIRAFVELTNMFENNNPDLSITDYFLYLKDLFTHRQKISARELQGIYSELLFMHYIYGKGVDLYRYWQSTDRMKFDFSINDTKKIEVKSTIGENRVHKFRHEQLVTDIFDIWIVSILLRKDDKGLSLYELANIVKQECGHNLKVLAHIQNLLLNYPIEDLKSMKFNKAYTIENIALYKAIDVPKFQGRQPNGVSNTEYDSDLNNISNRAIEEFFEWLK